MSDRPAPTGNRARLIAIMRTRALTAENTARILGVSEQYVRMLRSGIRETSDEHIATLEEKLGMRAQSDATSASGGA